MSLPRTALLLIAFLLSIVPFIGHAGSETEKPDHTLMIPMRDGTLLPTDIYLPHPEAKNLPCILLRGPSGRNSRSGTAYIGLAKHGYIIAIQDSRSALDKEGRSLPYFTDGWGKFQDGYDTVDWLAKHPLTNGKIGTLGGSNMGITQLLMAPTAPPALKCQYIGVAAASLYHHAIYPGGTLLKNQVEGWLGLFAKHPNVLQFIKGQPDYNDFWGSLDTRSVAHQVNAPGVHQGGWYDIFIQGTIESFVSRQEKGGSGAKNNQKLFIGPWVHLWPSTTKLGQFEVPLEGHKSPYDLSPKSWFDFHLKGIDNAMGEIPPVVYYVMGPFDGSPSSGNIWRTSPTWPIPYKEMALYLTADRRLAAASESAQNTVSYPHDPHHPVPTIGGRNLFLEAGPIGV